jgi:hypothetical protein
MRKYIIEMLEAFFGSDFIEMLRAFFYSDFMVFINSHLILIRICQIILAFIYILYQIRDQPKKQQVIIVVKILCAIVLARIVTTLGEILGKRK